ncbi:MAG: hypothetical protein R2874_11945 [Desulfobacterales bacterium]
MTLLFFIFHIGAIGIPLFLFAHNMVLSETFGFSFFSINQTVADIMSWGVVVSAALLAIRRLVLPGSPHSNNLL